MHNIIYIYLFSTVHISRTLSIFRMEKVLVYMCITSIGFLSPCQLRYNIKFLIIYNLKSDSYLVIWEFESLKLQYHSISILGSSFLKIYFLYIFVLYRSYFKNLIHIQNGNSSCLYVRNRKFQPQGLLIFWFLYTGFYCISLHEEFLILKQCSYQVTNLLIQQNFGIERTTKNLLGKVIFAVLRKTFPYSLDKFNTYVTYDIEAFQQNHLFIPF